MHARDRDELELAGEEMGSLYPQQYPQPYPAYQQPPMMDPYGGYPEPAAMYPDPYGGQPAYPSYPSPAPMREVNVYDQALASYGVRRRRRPVAAPAEPADPFNPPDRGRSRFWRTVDMHRERLDAKLAAGKEVSSRDLDALVHLRGQAFKEDHGRYMRPSARRAFKGALWQYVEEEQEALKGGGATRYGNSRARYTRTSSPRKGVVISTPGAGPKGRMNHLEAEIRNMARRGGVPRTKVAEYINAAFAHAKTRTKSMTKADEAKLRKTLDAKIRDIIKRSGGSVSGLQAPHGSLAGARAAKQQLQTSVVKEVAPRTNTFSKLAYLGV